jgi:hypothetical protein
MSALGHKQTLDCCSLMSAIPPKADIAGRPLDVRFVPLGDIPYMHACGRAGLLFLIISGMAFQCAQVRRWPGVRYRWSA